MENYDLGENVAENDEKCSPAEKCNRFSNLVHETLEEIFKRVGIFVGTYPIWMMVVCFLLNLAFLPGLLFFLDVLPISAVSGVENSHHEEARSFAEEYFPVNYTENDVIIVADNVMDPDTLKQIWNFHKSITLINDGSLDDLCHRFINGECLVRSIFEAWSYNDTVIKSLSAEEIASAVNDIRISPVFDDLMRTEYYLKTAIRIKYNTVQKAGLPEWEAAFKEKCSSAAETYSALNNVYYYTSTMYSEEIVNSQTDDRDLAYVGYGVIILYACLFSGSLSLVHTRFLPAIGSAISAAMAIHASFGICVYTGTPFTTFNVKIVFLILCINADNQFVLSSALTRVRRIHPHLSIPERMGQMLAEGGTSLLICAFADVIALGVGCISVVAILGMVGMTAFFGYSISALNYNSEDIWWLRKGTPAHEYLEAEGRYFGRKTLQTAVYIGHSDFFAEKDKLLHLAHEMDVDKYTLSGTVESWYSEYVEWLKTANVSRDLLDPDTSFPVNHSSFYTLLDEYLEAEGRIYRKYIYFDHGEVAATLFPVVHVEFTSFHDSVSAMEHLVDLAHHTCHHCYAYVSEYLDIETLEHLKKELFISVMLALTAVAGVVLIFLATPLMSIYITVNVSIVLVNIAGCIQVAGFVMDELAVTVFIQAIGFCIDGSVHISESFMNCEGTRNERTRKTLHHMGPSVLHGILSSLLGLLPFVTAGSYISLTYFYLFCIVMAFCLYYGLVFLPVVLSLIGPLAYDSAGHHTDQRNGHSEDMRKNGVNNYAINTSL
ncbi:hypothetical protein CAPTEDRAFT_224941 [Capitella teleta]|uniref:SSD domain-containing protein n=1 Tax=Capitella teleta TaxID=283909 RepID=R7TXP5_CAPTE|nr:hypothetical protein CAPTEDRAFT_224941 [Capitella teleta]|eukprot:ELT98357.1 hypothetical protein CAPTEDRAFT_224941 [Capitella teleta]